MGMTGRSSEKRRVGLGYNDKITREGERGRGGGGGGGGEEKGLWERSERFRNNTINNDISIHCKQTCIYYMYLPSKK